MFCMHARARRYDGFTTAKVRKTDADRQYENDGIAMRAV